MLKKGHFLIVIFFSLIFPCEELPDRPLLATEKKYVFPQENNIEDSQKKELPVLKNSEFKVDVKGTVFNYKTKLPVQGCIVSYGENSTVSDKDGNYVIRELPEGSYPVSAKAEGYKILKNVIEVKKNYSTTDFFYCSCDIETG